MFASDSNNLPPSSMETLFPLMVIVFFSNLVEACAGFGATILAIIFGAQFFAIEDLVPMLVPLNLVLSLFLVIRYWGDIDRKALLTRILPLAGIGMPIGIAIFHIAPSETLKLVFGIAVALLGVVELATSPSKRRLGPIQGAFFLIAGGIMQGLYASGGPLIVYYASREIPEKRRFRTTLALLWLILNVVLLFSLAFSGKITVYTLQFSAWLLPFVLMGMFAGIKVHDFVSEQTFKRLVYFLLVIAGTSLAYRTAS